MMLDALHIATVERVRDERWHVDEYRGVCDTCDWESEVYVTRGRALTATRSHMRIHNRDDSR